MNRTILGLIEAAEIALEILPLALIIAVALSILLRLLGKQTNKKLLVKAILCNIYFIGVLNVTGITYHFSTLNEVMAGCYAQPNLVLFRYLTTWDMLLNIIMMIPLGFILMDIGHASALQAVGIGLIVTMVIECVQFLQGRCFDINDIFFNTIGTGIGVLCYLFYRWVRKHLLY